MVDVDRLKMELEMALWHMFKAFGFECSRYVSGWIECRNPEAKVKVQFLMMGGYDGRDTA